MLGLLISRDAANTTVHSPPGVVFRPCRGEVDFPAMAAVVAGCREWDRIDPRSEVEHIPSAGDLARVLAAMPGCDLDKNVLIVEGEGSVIGYNVISWCTEDDNTRLYCHRGYVLPEWRGRGIGTAMLHWAEERIREIAGGQAMVSTNASSTEKETTRLLFKEGYFPAQSVSEMALDLSRRIPSAYLPLDFELRPARIEHFREIWGMCADGKGRGALAEEAYQAFLTNPRFDASLWRVAWIGEQIAGVVFCEQSGDVGLVTCVSVRSPWRHSGLARGILLHALHGLRARGSTQARLYTNADAMHAENTLFASVGFRVLKQYTCYRKPVGTL